MNSAIDFYGLGQLPQQQVATGADGAQHLTAAGQASILPILSGLYLIPGTPVPPNLLPQGAQVASFRAVRCNVFQQFSGQPQTGTGCFPSAYDFLNQSGRIALVDYKSATTEQIDVLATDRPEVAVAFAKPGSQYAIMQPARGEPPGSPPSIAKKKTAGAGPAIAGAVGGGLVGLLVGGVGGAAAGAAVGGIGGAILGSRKT